MLEITYVVYVYFTNGEYDAVGMKTDEPLTEQQIAELAERFITTGVINAYCQQGFAFHPERIAGVKIKRSE